MKFRYISYSFAGLSVVLALLWSVACGDQPEPEPNPTSTLRAADYYSDSGGNSDTKRRGRASAYTWAYFDSHQNTHTRSCADRDAYGGYTEAGSASQANTRPQISGRYPEPGKRPEHRASGCPPRCIPRAFELGAWYSLLQANAFGDRARHTSSGLVPGVRHMRGLDDGVADILPVQSTRRRQVA